ncbi:MAG: 30S ribosomal protein S6e [Candidatus Thermoplasmatota archaeon]|jgi:small subunit ribosomal protein S6e|nr:30S ribosomal protein S6e [Candidatus Thermoplasmatota archaeon]
MANAMALIADPKTGKTYKKEVTPENLGSLSGRKIGEELDGVFFNLPGYRLKLTGGTSIDGFAMRSDLQLAGKKKILKTYTSGKFGKEGKRKRVTVRGAIVGTDIAQLNLKIIQYGPNPVEEEKAQGQ